MSAVKVYCQGGCGCTASITTSRERGIRWWCSGACGKCR